MRIDLNSDLGESFGAWPMGQDAALDAGHLLGQRGLRLPRRRPRGDAADRGAGADATAWRSARIPGFRTWSASAGARCAAHPSEVEDFVLYQVGALAAIAAAQGVRLQHVKAHGALYNMACARSRRWLTPSRAPPPPSIASLILFGLPGSALLRRRRARRPAGRRGSASPIAPTTPTGRSSRGPAGSVIHDPRHGRRARGADGAGTHRRRRRRRGHSARRRHDLRARRHAGRGGARRGDSKSARDRRRWRECSVLGADLKV